MTIPTISVILPAYNAERTIEAAVGSILRQTHTQLELLVVDDGSTDSTVELLRRFDDDRLSIIEGGGNQGLPKRLNQLLGLARGDFVARMDADDVAFPRRFEVQLEALERRHLDIIGSAIVVIDDDYRPRGIRRSPTSHEDICASPWAGFYMPHPTWLARTEKLVAFGYRDFSLCEDQELLLRAHRWLRLGNTEEVLLGYREGAPSWRKIRRGRTSFIKGLRANSSEIGRPLSLAIAEQYAKLAVDRVALSTGLSERLLAHRRGTPDAAVYAEWDCVCASLGLPTDGKTTPLS